MSAVKEVIYAPHDAVENLERKGWTKAGSLDGTRHGLYSVIMERPAPRETATVRQSTAGVFVVIQEPDREVFLRIESANPIDARDCRLAHKVACALNRLDK